MTILSTLLVVVHKVVGQLLLLERINELVEWLDDFWSLVSNSDGGRHITQQAKSLQKRKI